MCRALVFLRPFPCRPVAEFRLKPKDDYDPTDKYSFDLREQFDLSFFNQDKELEAKSKAIDEKYDISSWVKINTVITVSWKEWISFDLLIKRAIINNIEEIVRERQNRESSLANSLQDLPSSSMNFKNMNNTPVGRILNR